ncbi:unnamed protein product [Coffea canephora]|uniref:Protein FAR1-RELATED SEQUENCE n=1 Tax=Coffea canephora TaxID=49390 RepID=A0A068UKD9_COFCA|nr:unnamed protein product [Coffea canephora]
MERELGTECPMEQDQVDHDAAHGSMPEDSTNEQIEPGKDVNLYVGMGFESLGDAFKCYSNYAHNKGFSVRRNRITKSRSNKSIIGQEFKYKLQNNTWIQKVYSIRERWVPAFVHASFCAGMSTTQRSESMNKFFKDYLNSSTAMSKFVTQYDRAIKARYDKEKEKNFNTKNTKPILKTLMCFNDIMVRLQALSNKLDDLPYENEQANNLSISQVDSHSEIHDLTQGQHISKECNSIQPRNSCIKRLSSHLTDEGWFRKVS